MGVIRDACVLLGEFGMMKLLSFLVSYSPVAFRLMAGAGIWDRAACSAELVVGVFLCFIRDEDSVVRFLVHRLGDKRHYPVNRAFGCV